MKYCNKSDCIWNDQNGICTYFSFEEEEEPEQEERRLCRKEAASKHEQKNDEASG